MKRLEMFLIYFSFIFASSVLFQNCGEMKSANLGSQGTLDTTPPVDDRPIPEFLSNRTITLDNKATVGTSQWGAGQDVFYYETNYRATFESTLVTVSGRNGQVFAQVVADDCEGEVPISANDGNALNVLILSGFQSSRERLGQPNDPVVPGCGFPRLAVDTKTLASNNQPYIDFEFYYASQECTPVGDLYVSDRMDDNQMPFNPTQLKTEIEAFFNPLIDAACGI